MGSSMLRVRGSQSLKTSHSALHQRSMIRKTLPSTLCILKCARWQLETRASILRIKHVHGKRRREKLARIQNHSQTTMLFAKSFWCHEGWRISLDKTSASWTLHCSFYEPVNLLSSYVQSGFTQHRAPFRMENVLCAPLKGRFWTRPLFKALASLQSYLQLLKTVTITKANTMQAVWFQKYWEASELGLGSLRRASILHTIKL